VICQQPEETFLFGPEDDLFAGSRLESLNPEPDTFECLD